MLAYALCFMLSKTYYAQNYAGIIDIYYGATKHIDYVATVH